MVRPALTPESLFEYATAFAAAAVARGEGTKYPTFFVAARHFKVRQTDIDDTCSQWSGDGYLGAAVGFRTGSGYATFKRPGDRLVEAYC